MERMKKGAEFGIHADSRSNRDVGFQVVGAYQQRGCRL